MVEIKEVLRGWLGGAGLRTVAARAGVDRKTARRYVQAAQEAGLGREAEFEAVDDDLIAAVVTAVRPVRPNGHGPAWESLMAHQEQISAWVAGEGTGRGKTGRGLSIVKIHELLERRGVQVPYRTLHRFATERCGYRAKEVTVPVVDGQPGVELQVDFGYLGYLTDPADGRRRKVHALIFTAVFSRHMFVWLTYSQTLTAVVAGCQSAWAFFGGVFKVLIPDNLKPVVTDADAVNPTLSSGWLDYAQHAGFGTDPARIRSPKDKPRVERAVQYVRGNFWAGETFTDLAEAQRRVQAWCAGRAGMRTHGTTQARPAEVFAEHEAGQLLPAPGVYDIPIFRLVKVHRDFHVEVAKALYSVPGDYLGQQLQARADSELVKFYHRGVLVKTHPRQRPGARSTDKADLPAEKSIYALRDLKALIAKAASHGHNIGIYAERILDDPLPWTRMRTVYRLLGLVKRYGPEPVETACARALELDVISVTKIDSMLTRATEATEVVLPLAAAPATSRFARDPAEYTHTSTATVATNGTATASAGTGPASEGTTGTLTLVRGGQAAGTFEAIELPQEN